MVRKIKCSVREISPKLEEEEQIPRKTNITDLENFKVHLNSRAYFNVIFPKLVRYRWRDSEACDETNNDGIVDDKSFENTLMLQTMATVCVAAWECGISQEDIKKPGILGAIYRFHVYFTVRRILRTRGRLAFYILGNSVRENVWKYLPAMFELYDYKKGRVCKLVEITDKDFIYMVAPTTKGITRLGVSFDFVLRATVDDNFSSC